MKRYSPEFKESIVRKMIPAENVPIMRLAEESKFVYRSNQTGALPDAP